MLALSGAESRSAPTTRIRSFTPADVDAIMALFYQTVHSVNIRDYTRDQVDAWAPREMDRRRWLDRLTGSQTFVADVGGVIAGFGNLEPSGHIDLFYVHQDYQGLGVGTSLLTAIEAAARLQGVVRLFTEASITARAFFERAGFRVAKEQSVIVRGVELTNYVMAKRVEDG